jgi:hypothetical protein
VTAVLWSGAAVAAVVLVVVIGRRLFERVLRRITW